MHIWACFKRACTCMQNTDDTFGPRREKKAFLARLHEVHRAIVVTSVVSVYVYVYVPGIILEGAMGKIAL